MTIVTELLLKTFVTFAAKNGLFLQLLKAPDGGWWFKVENQAPSLGEIPIEVKIDEMVRLARRQQADRVKAEAKCYRWLLNVAAQEEGDEFGISVIVPKDPNNPRIAFDRLIKAEAGRSMGD